MAIMGTERGRCHFSHANNQRPGPGNTKSKMLWRGEGDAEGKDFSGPNHPTKSRVSPFWHSAPDMSREWALYDVEDITPRVRMLTCSRTNR